MATKREIFTIQEEIVNNLNSYCQEKLIPKSRLVSKLLKEFFENIKINEQKINK